MYKINHQNSRQSRSATFHPVVAPLFVHKHTTVKYFFADRSKFCSIELNHCWAYKTHFKPYSVTRSILPIYNMTDHVFGAMIYLIHSTNTTPASIHTPPFPYSIIQGSLSPSLTTPWYWAYQGFNRELLYLPPHFI